MGKIVDIKTILSQTVFIAYRHVGCCVILAFLSDRTTTARTFAHSLGGTDRATSFAWNYFEASHCMYNLPHLRETASEKIVLRIRVHRTLCTDGWFLPSLSSLGRSMSASGRK